jgi:hypothetical protein
MLTPEQMVAIAASRPAVLQQQSVALAALTGITQAGTPAHSGTTGQGTPAVDASGHIDLYA